jgi:hypothetical protein
MSDQWQAVEKSLHGHYLPGYVFGDGKPDDFGRGLNVSSIAPCGHLPPLRRVPAGQVVEPA